MKNLNTYILTGFVAITVGMMTGCGGAQKAADQAPAAIATNAPAWVNQGAAAFKNDPSKALYGVGMVSGINNRALAVETADARARGAIAKTLETYVTALNKDYMASTTAGDMKQSSEEQHVASTMKSLTTVTLRGAVIVDHWKDPTDGTMFALAKLDFENVKNTLAQANELDAKVRDFVRDNADKAFSELDDKTANK